MKTVKEMMYELFTTAFDFMFFSSGDGTSLIICDDYVELAKFFEQWANENHPDYFDKILIDDQHFSVLFNGVDTEEAIIFAKDLGERYHNMYEFVCVLPNWYTNYLE